MVQVLRTKNITIEVAEDYIQEVKDIIKECDGDVEKAIIFLGEDEEIVHYINDNY